MIHRANHLRKEPTNLAILQSSLNARFFVLNDKEEVLVHKHLQAIKWFTPADDHQLIKAASSVSSSSSSSSSNNIFVVYLGSIMRNVDAKKMGSYTNVYYNTNFAIPDLLRPSSLPSSASSFSASAREIAAHDTSIFAIAGIKDFPKDDDLAFLDVRSLSRTLTFAIEGEIACLGKSLAYWHRKSQFCSSCGGKTVATEGGTKRICTNTTACQMEFYPRTDPVTIMLVVRDTDYCLLGRKAAFPKGMWSCLAGFMEQGESISDAVQREVQEESGVVCGEVRIQMSQPWPNPHQLMIGCVATAFSSDITVDQEELEDVRWFHRDEIVKYFAVYNREGNKNLVDTQQFHLPSHQAIAHHLIRNWVLASSSSSPPPATNNKL